MRTKTSVLRQLPLAICVLCLFCLGCEEEGSVENDRQHASADVLDGRMDGKADGYWEDQEHDARGTIGMDWNAIAERCAPPAANEPQLTYGHYGWNQSLEEMAELFEEMYRAPDRLPGRAYWDDERSVFVLPIPEVWGGEAVLSKRLVSSVRGQIERALELNYVDFIFFSDMGHSHFLFPEDHWRENYAGVAVAEIGERYTRMLADPKLRILYHTAEQLGFLDEENQLRFDRHLQWRFYTRNLVGYNDEVGHLDIVHNASHVANTARGLDEHHYYGAGFYLSAHENGCFPYHYEGETSYFDLSLQNLSY